MILTPLLMMMVLADTDLVGPPTPDAAPRHVNALIHETSPYLLQHAYNPVDWRPWGLEAIEEARDAEKPIFLSIGYSTCYWCHVMERESFEDQATADILNRDFIPIKVDREERPDVDEIYMAGVQVLTGRGGWPMSMFIEPYSLRPFGGGTYFPPEARYNKPGFKDLLNQVTDEWNTQREELDQRAYETGQQIQARLDIQRQPESISKSSVTRAASSLLVNHDEDYGGFRKTAPKFPIPVQLDFLIETSWDDPKIRAALKNTLDKMAQGGIFDQVGGGFHRYSTDKKWLIPHFEKMLYDNGQLASVYAKAAERSGDRYYRQVVEDTLDYILREMTSPEGGFYSAQDAEVNHREGQNYLWLPVEVRTTLTAAGLPDQVEFALNVYGLNKPPNFRDPHHRNEPPRHVLHMPTHPGELAKSMGISPDELQSRLDTINETLLLERNQRDQPGLDDKILSGWNGLMIMGMADGGRVLENTNYVKAANRAADFVLERMVNEEGLLQRSWREGVAKTNAFLEDYAFMIRGLLALYEATGDPIRLQQAEELAAMAKKLFWNEVQGGYWDTMPDQEDLFVRARTVRDSVVPSGNSMMIGNLTDLARQTGASTYKHDLKKSLRSMSPWIARSPTVPIHATGALQKIEPTDLEAISVGVPGNKENRNISIQTTPELLQLQPGQSSRIEVVFNIASGYHMNINTPVQKDLQGLTFITVGDQLEIEPDYPDGHTWEGPLGTMLVYEGRVVIPIEVRRPSTATKPQVNDRIVVRYQLCDNEVCLQPRAEVLKVQIGPGR